MFIARSSIPNRFRVTRLAQSLGLHHLHHLAFWTHFVYCHSLSLNMWHVCVGIHPKNKCSLSVSAFNLASPFPSHPKAGAEASRNKILSTRSTLDRITCNYTPIWLRYVVISHHRSPLHVCLTFLIHYSIQLLWLLLLRQLLHVWINFTESSLDNHAALHWSKRCSPGNPL